MQRRNFLFLCLFAILFSGCAGKLHKSDHLTAATIWMQSSGEAKALQKQGFILARLRLEQGLTAQSGKPSAVVVDVDETVLDNSPYQAWIIRENESYPAGWKEWIDLKQAKAIPGALEFLKFADEKKVQIFYVTNRKKEDCGATAENLKSEGFPQVSESSLLCREETSSKLPRFEKIGSQFNVLLFVGDSLGDFPESVAGTQIGVKYILLPNPMYGNWERAVYGGKENLSLREQRTMRWDSLKTFLKE